MSESTAILSNSPPEGTDSSSLGVRDERLQTLFTPVFNEWKEQRTPRVHGNGFIQVNLDPAGDRRLHVWHRNTPQAQKVYTPIHNHAFDFTSQVLTGTMQNHVYTPRSTYNGLWNAYDAVKLPNSEDTILEPSTEYIGPHSLRVSSTTTFKGGHYFLDGRMFHASDPVVYPTVTVMAKERKYKYRPTVWCMHLQTPDNNYRRENHDMERLWSLVIDALIVVPSFSLHQHFYPYMQGGNNTDGEK